jgi:hypothetical protein
VREPLLRRLRICSTTLHVEAGDADRLAAAGFSTYADFARARPPAGGRGSRSVCRIQAGPRPCFLKAYRYGGLRILRTFLYRAKADREFENLRDVAAAGVPAVRPVAWGVRRVLGFIPDSILVTEAFEGGQDARTLISDYAEGRPGTVPRAAFRALLDRVADGLRELHARGIYLHTAFEKNLLVRMAGDAAEYAWVDLPFAGRTAPGRLPMLRRVRDLACLNKGLEAALTAADRLRLLKRYAGAGAPRGAVRDLAARVHRRTLALRDRTPGARLVKILKGG